MVAEYILHDLQPFPGDERFPQLETESWEVNNRFSVTQRPKDSKNYMINDSLTNFRVKISKKNLADDSFDLGRWYTQKRLRHFNWETSDGAPIRKMTESWSIVARFLLADGISSSYPNVNPDTLSEFRFYVQKSRDKFGFYEIEDEDLEITTFIKAEMLENPTFNLIKWYRNQLEEENLYNDAYTKFALQNMEQHDSQDISDSETSEFLDGESVLATFLDMFDQELDEDFDDLPELQSVSDTDSDSESQAAPEGGLYYNSEPSLANLESNSLETRPTLLESTIRVDLETASDSGSSLGDLTGYELGKVGDIFAWKVQQVLTDCQPFPGDEIEALPIEFLNGKPRFEVTREEEFPNDDMYTISDHSRGIIASIHIARLRHDTFSIGKWYAEICAKQEGDHRPSVVRNWMQQHEYHETIIGAVREQYTAHILEMACPFAYEDDDVDRMDKRFDVQIDCHDITHLVIYDEFRQIVSQLPRESIEDPNFDLVSWYEFRLAQFELDQFDFTEAKIREVATDESAWPKIWDIIRRTLYSPMGDLESGNIEINGVQVARDKYPAVQRNAASVKDKTRVLPKPVTLTIKIDGHPARALVDSGSLGDFMSTNLADQLNVKREELEAPLGLQLAVQGSRSKINFRARSRFQYQGIDEERQFDIINLSNYDLILGTPWMYQHQVCLGFNPARVIIGTDTALPIKKGADTKLMIQAIDVGADELEQARNELRKYAEPLCKKMEETDLPPFRAINHTIPLIDVNKKYPWRPSRCPEPFRAQWAEKRDAYLKTGRWKVTSSGNTTPMLLIPKPRKKDMPLLLRTVNDLRERNANTYKLTSPLPDMEGMLRRAARKKFRSSMDLADAYEQIRVIPEHVDRTTTTTPDGNMVSLVIQIGDVNAPATYQALMNHIFSAYIGRFMDIYLDDIFIYSDTLEEHVKHVKLIIDILKKEKLYLSKKKLQFVAPELQILGRVIDDDGIRMDSDKVDTVGNWKIPTNRDLLRGFLGSVGYLA